MVSQMFLSIARDEIETIQRYNEMLMNNEEDDQAKAIVHEIIGDEFNHALIAIISAANALGIKIATDDIKPNPNDIEVQ